MLNAELLQQMVVEYRLLSMQEYDGGQEPTPVVIVCVHRAGVVDPVV